MSTLGDALNAIKSMILIEERVKTQASKLDRLAESMVAMDRRLVRVETTLDIVMRRASGAPAPPRTPA